MTTTPEPTPTALDEAEVYVSADHPDSFGRWYVRSDDTVVYRWPDGKWNESPIVSAATLRRSPVWTRAN